MFASSNLKFKPRRLKFLYFCVFSFLRGGCKCTPLHSAIDGHEEVGNFSSATNILLINIAMGPITN